MPSVFNKFIVGKDTKNPATHKGIAGLFRYFPAILLMMVVMSATFT